ncbi:hypothetical protein DNK59_31515, partial [Pseudomonas sp. TKO26]
VDLGNLVFLGDVDQPRHGAGKSDLRDALCRAGLGAGPRLSKIGKEDKGAGGDRGTAAGESSTMLRRGAGRGGAGGARRSGDGVRPPGD